MRLKPMTRVARDGLRTGRIDARPRKTGVHLTRQQDHLARDFFARIFVAREPRSAAGMAIAQSTCERARNSSMMVPGP